MIKVIYPWKMVGRFADGTETCGLGLCEEDALMSLINLIPIHGNLDWYSGYCDEDYVDGQYIGRENMIYD